MDLRPYQEEVLQGVRRAWASGSRRVLIQMPTGAGKTATAASAIQRAASRGRRVWFATHRSELIDQAVGTLQRFGLGARAFAASREEVTDAQVTVVSIPTVAARLQSGAALPDAPDFIVVDEAHHVVSESWRAVMGVLPESGHAMMLSATPYRSDGAALGLEIDAVVHGPTPRELADDGVLVVPQVFTANTDRGGVGDVVETYAARAPDTKALCFAASVPHSQELCDEFNALGFRAWHVDGETPAEEREAAIEALRGGGLDILSNVALFTEGFDLPSLETVILASKMESESLYVQKVGRGARSAPGKTSWTLLDHGGNVGRFGDPMAHRPADLDGRPPSKRKELVEGEESRLCTSCLAISFGRHRLCQFCGEEFKPSAVRWNKRVKLKAYEPEEPAGLEEMRETWKGIWEEFKSKPKSGSPWAPYTQFSRAYGRYPHKVPGLLNAEEMRRFRAVCFGGSRGRGKARG